MSNKVTVLPAHVREEQIAGLVQASKKTQTFYEYQNRANELPEIVLPIEVPIYRMANYRTRTAQQTFVRRESKPADFFRTGQENEAAQQIQHELLVKFAEQGRQGSVIPIVDVLKVEKQRGPLLITSRGIVVNGNRRLAGMRSLYGDGSGEFREFSHVTCLVLPATITEREIVEIEIRLQMKQRTELDYDWINECIAVKELRDGGRGIKELMALMNKKKGEIENAINALAEADLYLSDWLGRPGDYDAIEDAEQLFYDIGDNLKAKTGEAQELSRRIAWTLVDRRAKLKRRVYDFNPMFGKKADQVGSRLAERFGVELETSDTVEAENGEDDIDVDVGETTETTLRPLIALFDDPTRREELSDELVSVCEGIIETEKGHREGQMPLNLVQQANGKLSEIDITRATPGTLSAIEKQLDSIQAHVTRLKAAISRPSKEPPANA